MSQDSNKKPVVIIPQTNMTIRKIELEPHEQSEDLEADSEKISEIEYPFLNFVTSYSEFSNGVENTHLNLQQVLEELNKNVSAHCPPCQNLIPFNQTLSIGEKDILELADSLKSQPDSKLFSLIENIEKLYLKLSEDYEQEIKIAKQFKII